MKQWSLEFRKEVEKDLIKISPPAQRRIIGKLNWLLKNFDLISPLTLGGKFKNFYKLRAGDYRVIYKIHWKDEIIEVCYIDKRDKIYKKK